MDSLTAYRTELPPNESPPGSSLSKGLAWFSIGLGLTELLLPSTLAHAIGIAPEGKAPTALRATGLREIAAGLAILAMPNRPAPVANRVVGDLVDLAMLAWAAKSARENTPRLIAAAGVVLGALAIDAFATKKVAKAFGERHPVIFSVTIARPPAEVYAYWRKLDQLPLFMDYLESVTETGPTTSRWIAKLPVAGTVEWDAKITEDRPNELIAWESVPGSVVKTKGKVTFAKAPGRESTEVRVEMAIAPAGLRPSTVLAKFAAKPEIKGDLRRFKQIMETGEVLFSDASRHAMPHPAQPSADGRKAEYTNPAPRMQVSSSSVKPRSPEPALAASPTPPADLEPKKGYVS